MKTLLLLIVTFLSLQLSAQTGMEKAIEISKRYSKFNIQSLVQGHNRSQLPKTHTLDSIVSRDDNGVVLSKTEMTYDNEGRTTLIRQYDLDSTGTTLELTSTITLEYEGGDGPSLITITFPTEAGEPAEILEFEIYYLSSGKVDSFVLSQTDPFSGEFGELIASKNIYDGDLLVETKTYFYFSLFGSWFPSGGSEFIYDSEGKLIEEIIYTADFTTFEVIPQSRIVYSYNASDLRDTITNYYYVNDAWELGDRTYFDFYASGLVENEVFQTYVNNAWVNSSWFQYHQDELVDEYDLTTYTWITDAWVKADSTHDELNPSLLWENVYTPTQFSVIATDEFAVDFLNMENPVIDVRSYFQFDDVTGEIIFSQHDYYYYSVFDPSAVEDVLPEFISISPNPSSDLTQIKMDADEKGSYTISSLTGQFISGGKLAQGVTSVPTANLAPGMYIFVLRLEDGSAYMHKQVIQ